MVLPGAGTSTGDLFMQNHKQWSGSWAVYRPVSPALSPTEGLIYPFARWGTCHSAAYPAVCLRIGFLLCCQAGNQCWQSEELLLPPRELQSLQAEGVGVCPGVPGAKLSLYNQKPSCELESNQMQTQTGAFPQAIFTNLLTLFLCSRVIFFRTLVPSSCSQCLALQYQLSLWVEESISWAG